jgi:hypothetical protein
VSCGEQLPEGLRATGTNVVGVAAPKPPRTNWRFCGRAERGRTAAALGTCKHLGIVPFAYLCEALPALFALGEAAGEVALMYWLPDVWRRRQDKVTAMTAVELPEAAP